MKELWFLLVVGILALVGIYLQNLPLEGIAFLLLLVYSFLETRQVVRLKRWLAAPLNKPTVTRGKWGRIFNALSTMNQAQQRMQERITRSLQRFQKGVAVFPDGLVLLDEHDIIEWCNPAAERLIGISLAKDRGQHIHFFLRQRAFREYLREPETGTPLILKLKLNHAPEHILEIQALPFGEKQTLLLIRDITLIHQMANAQKEFVANVSHELRTPITVIMGFLEMLQENSNLAEAEQRYILLMREQAKRMQELIEDLLALSRLEAADSKASYEVIDMHELLSLILAEAKQLSHNSHEITLHFEENLALQGSRSEIHSAFSNLVSNAIRYTPKGGKIHFCWLKQTNQEAAFIVEDTGIGIEPQHLPKLTDRFYRVDRSRSRETGGTGLGLAIVQQVALRHDARLEIASTPGQGSTFKMIFPEHRLVYWQEKEKQAL